MPYAIAQKTLEAPTIEQLKQMLRALGLLCAVAGAVLGGELTAEGRRLAEESFLKAMMLPIRAQMQSILETREDPFAADHWLSRVKPPLKPKPMPAPDPHAKRQEFGGTGFGKPFLLVAPPPECETKRTEDFRPLDDGETSWWVIYGPRGVGICAFPSAVHMIPLKLPKEHVARLRRLDERMGTDHTRQILRELGRLRKMDKFDLIRHVVGLDASSFGPGRSFPLRVVNLMLVTHKHHFVWMLAKERRVAYYASDSVRCLVMGPAYVIQERVREDGRTETCREEHFMAEVAVRDCEQVISVWWGSEAGGSPQATLKDFLTFLASFRANAAPAPKPERKQTGDE